MQKYNMFMAQIGCAAIGVVAYTLFGPGWLARSAGLAACIAYMIWTRAVHPPGTFLIPIYAHTLSYFCIQPKLSLVPFILCM